MSASENGAPSGNQKLPSPSLQSGYEAMEALRQAEIKRVCGIWETHIAQLKEGFRNEIEKKDEIIAKKDEVIGRLEKEIALLKNQASSQIPPPPPPSAPVGSLQEEAPNNQEEKNTYYMTSQLFNLSSPLKPPSRDGPSDFFDYFEQQSLPPSSPSTRTGENFQLLVATPRSGPNSSPPAPQPLPAPQLPPVASGSASSPDDHQTLPSDPHSVNSDGLRAEEPMQPYLPPSSPPVPDVEMGEPQHLPGPPSDPLEVPSADTTMESVELDNSTVENDIRPAKADDTQVGTTTDASTERTEVDQERTEEPGPSPTHPPNAQPGQAERRQPREFRRFPRPPYRTLRNTKGPDLTGMKVVDFVELPATNSSSPPSSD